MALDSAWTIWAHLPHEQDWSMASYTPIMRVTTACELWGLIQLLPQALITDLMLFLMKDDTKPIWEDPVNSQGGYFSYKVMNKNVGEAWKALMLRVGGGTLSDDAEFNKTVTGVSISPKKGFCIIKLWMGTKRFTNPSNVTSPYLVAAESRFSAH